MEIEQPAGTRSSGLSRRMDQKRTGFHRELRDREFVERIMAVEEKVDRAAQGKKPA